MRHKKLLASILAGVSLSLLAVALLPKTGNVIKANAADETKVIDEADSDFASITYNSTSMTLDGISYGIDAVMRGVNSSNHYIQLRKYTSTKTAGLIYNTTAFDAGIKSIEFVEADDSGKTTIDLTVYVGDSEHPTSGIGTPVSEAGKYNFDGTHKYVTILNGNTSPSYMDKIIFTYEGGTPADPITKIEVTTPPTKTSYHVGESFDPTGMYVEGTHEGGTKEEITNYVYSPAGALDAGTEEITISYGELDCTTPISVIVPTIDSITVTNMPTKPIYYVGDELETDGIVVMGHCSHCEKDIDVTASCSFSPTSFTASDIGNKTITVTYDTNITTSFNVTVTAAPSLPIYTLVTSVDDLEIDNKVLITGIKDENLKVMGPVNSNNRNFSIVDGSLTSGKIVGLPVGALELTLEAGNTAGTYVFTDGSKYVSGQDGNNNYLQFNANKTSFSEWNITITNGETSIICADSNCSRNSIRFNGSSNVFAAYASGQSPVSIYQLSGGTENITLNETEASGPTGDSISLTATPSGFEPTSYHWDVSDTAVLSLDSYDDQTVIVTYVGEGVATATCTASDGTIVRQASCTITVHNYTYNVLTGNDYIITNSDYSIGLSTTDPTTDISNVDITDASNAYHFVKAHKADNSYYLKAGDSYLQKNGTQARLGFFEEPTTYWVVSRPTSGVEIFNVVDSNGNKLIYNPNNTGIRWIAITNPSDVSQMQLGLLEVQEFINLSSEGTLAKNVFNVDEDFDPTGLTIYANYTSVKKDVTSSMSWSPLHVGDTSAHGQIEIKGVQREIQIEGIQVTDYQLNQLEIDYSGAKTEYFVGQQPSKEGLVVTAVYVDDAHIGEEKEVVLASNEYTLSPETITASTSEITVTYNNHSNSYPITVKPVKFDYANSITAGDHVVFGAGSVDLEMAYDTFAVKEFDYRPNGDLVFEVEKVSNGVWAFRELETGNYLAADGKALDWATSKVPAATWEVSITRTDTYDTVYVESKSQTDYLYMAYNSDAGKIKMANTSDIEIYKDITLNKPQSIEVDTSSTHETEFDVGETFSYSGLKIKVNWNEEGAFTVIDTGFQVETPDMLTAGQKSVKVTYMGVETSYTINVKPSSQHIMVGIEASGMKNVFIVGECFSFGGKVEAVFADNTREDLNASDYVITGQPDEGVPFTEAQVGIKQITVTYKLNTEFKYVYDIEIVSNDHNDLQSISVVNPVTTYNVGDEFVKPTVMAQFEFGDPVNVTNEATFSGYNMNQAGTYTVQVSYSAGEITKHTSFTITVGNGGGTSEDPTSGGGSSSGSTSEGGGSKQSINVLAWAIPVIIGSVIVLGGVGVGIYFLVKHKKNK